MSSGSELAKLAELRARTDRQLVEIIRAELEFGLDLACQGTIESRDGEFAEQARARAERAYAEALSLLPVAYALGEEERRRLEVLGQQLRKVLDRLRLSVEVLAA